MNIIRNVKYEITGPNGDVYSGVTEVSTSTVSRPSPKPPQRLSNGSLAKAFYAVAAVAVVGGAVALFKNDAPSSTADKDYVLQPQKSLDEMLADGTRARREAAEAMVAKMDADRERAMLNNMAAAATKSPYGAVIIPSDTGKMDVTVLAAAATFPAPLPPAKPSCMKGKRRPAC
jgi:hypothetical protein